MRRLLLIVVALVVMGAGKFDPAAASRADLHPEGYTPVSLIALLANPTLYDGKRVKVSGYITLKFEDAGLHLDRIAYEGGLYTNALWLDPPSWLSRPERKRLTDRYGTVYARFNANKHGHLDLFPGELEDVRLIRPSRTNADFQRYMSRTSDEVFLLHMPVWLTLSAVIAAVTILVVRVIIKRQQRR